MMLQVIYHFLMSKRNFSNHRLSYSVKRYFLRGMVFFIEAETTLLFHVRGDLGEGSMINIVKILLQEE